MKEKTITIQGIVVPAEWDEKGAVLGVALSTPDEKEYLICRDAKGEELAAFLRHEVEITGVVSRHGRKRAISVIEYRLKNTPAPEGAA